MLFLRTLLLLAVCFCLASPVMAAAANPTAIWRVRPSGSNTNGGGYDPGITSAGTDYSQQDAAQLSNIGTCTTATTTLTDTGASFTSALIGNGIYVHGTSITTTFTFITAVPSSTTLTLQASPGTAGTAVTYNVGGAWANFWTNTTAAPLVAGNTVYILGGASPSYASPDYAPSAYFQPLSSVNFIGDPGTPGGNGYSGYPLIKTPGCLWFEPAGVMIKNLWMFAGGTANAGLSVVLSTNKTSVVNCIYDANGKDIGFIYFDGGIGGLILNCEMFSSSSPRSGGAYYQVSVRSSLNALIEGCNIHDNVGPGILVSAFSGMILNNIISNNGGDGIFTSSSTYSSPIIGNTIDGNTGDGIEFNDPTTLSLTACFNNIISNHVTAATYGIKIDSGTTASNSNLAVLTNWNGFYNNTTNYYAISASANDTALASNPYNGQSTEDYSLNLTNISNTGAYPNAAFPQHLSGQTTTVQSYVYPGAVQPYGSTTNVTGPQIYSSGFGL